MSSLKQLRLDDQGAVTKKPSVGPKKTLPKGNKKQVIEEIAEEQEHPTAEEIAAAQALENDSVEPDVLSCGKSIVKLFVSSNSPDAGMPYQLERATPSTSSGFIIEYNGQNFIITNAHCVQHFTTVQLKKYGSSRKYRAQVLFIADTCDLAVLTVEDRRFWRNAVPLKIVGPPTVNSTVYVAGYPTGGDELSITSGLVSRLGVQPYAHSGDLYLCLQTSAAINSGNSGGPCLMRDEHTKQFVCVGVAFEAMMGANSIGYMISTTVVNNMLESFRTNNPGCPSLNMITQGIESQVQRDSLFVPPLAGLFDYLFDMSQVQSTLLQLMEQNGVDISQIGAEGEEDEDAEGKESPKSTKMVDGADAEEDQDEDMEDEDDEANAEHFIIGQDDEYDYVVFKKTEEEDLDEEDLDGLADLDQSNDEDEDYEDEDSEEASSPEDKKAKADELKQAKAALAAAKAEKAQKAPKSPLVAKNKDHALEIELGNEDTPLYRIKRTSNIRPPPPVDLLPLLMSENGLYETQIGIVVRNIIPHTPTAELLKIGDVVLAIDNIPISSDETILFRENERVRYSFLTTNRQIGTTCSILVLRGFDIFTVEIPIQKKQTIAQLFNYKIPQWLVALGLLFVPLSGNLLEAEFGENWTSESPVSLLQTLFLGILDRFDANEEAIVLTQVLAHDATEGYDQQMERLTHVNGERIINMKHLATVLNAAVSEYDKTKAEMDAMKAQMMGKKDHSPRDIAASPQDSKLESLPEPQEVPEDEEEVMEPAVFHKMFAEQLNAYSKVNFIIFTLQSGTNITLSLNNGHRTQVEILKLHQIPLPGCSESLLPMYDMSVGVKFANEAHGEAILIPSEPKPSKSAQKANILSPTPLSPRDSFRTTPHEQKLYRAASGKDNVIINSPNTENNAKVLSSLESQPELVQSQFSGDFPPRSPVEKLKKFAKKVEEPKKKK